LIVRPRFAKAERFTVTRDAEQPLHTIVALPHRLGVGRGDAKLLGIDERENGPSHDDEPVRIVLARAAERLARDLPSRISVRRARQLRTNRAQLRNVGGVDATPAAGEFLHDGGEVRCAQESSSSASPV
jgi:hypothetical protein